MKKKILQLKLIVKAVMVALLIAVVGIMKGYAYNVTVSSTSNGTVVANPTTANEGEIVTLTATPESMYGFALENWTVVDGDNEPITITQDGDNPNTGTFIMPASDVTVTATFSKLYRLHLVYGDVQARETLMPGLGATHNIEYEQLPDLESRITWWRSDHERTSGFLALAQNEKEGFQVFFRELEKERYLKIEVSPFLNAQNEVLAHSLYYEEFFYDAGVYTSDSLAEALVPYEGTSIKTFVGHNKMFYVELNSTKNQTPGEYYSTITLYDGHEVLNTRTVTAKVWDFALPEGHYSEVVMGLYNRNSGYGATSSFLKLNGIDVDDNGNVAETDLSVTKQILDGYQECLLEHGVSTYEIPRWKMADDPKSAELTMADPRRKMFEIPVHWFDLSGSSFNSSAQRVINQYKDIVYNNVFLKDKAFFYPMDERDWNDANNVELLNNACAAISESWPGYHAVIPFKDNSYDQNVNMFEGRVDILCPNQEYFNPWSNSGIDVSESNLQDFKNRDHTWRYQGNSLCGGIYVYISPMMSVGVMRRILFWQQRKINSDGFLNWNCAFLPSNWEKKVFPVSGGIQTGNGDGILLYPGTMFGQDANTPIVSLRLKQLSSGIDDFDYLNLTKEFIGDDALSERLTYIFGTPDYLCNIMNRETSFIGWSCQFLQIARYNMGQALSAANTEHNWGEWQIAVLPDETHDGLEIRCCQDCGTQESRPKTYSSLYRFVGTEDNQWANLNNWANNPETLPTSGESVVIASDCEINDNTEVFYVVVNDGFNLTVNEGTTLTSQRITTEGNAQIIVEDGAQLFSQSEGVQATVKKNITSQGYTERWHFISTSLASDVVPSESNGLLSSTEDNFDLYGFNQSDNLEWRNYKSNSFSLENGMGYLYANSEENLSLVFTGVTNGNISKEFGLDYDANVYLAGWNLVGNPYPCEVYANTSYYRGLLKIDKILCIKQ